MSTTPIIDKAKLLAKSKANLKRTAAIVRAINGPPALTPAPASPPAAKPPPATAALPSAPLVVAPIEGEAFGTTSVRKLLNNHVAPALVMQNLCIGVTEKMTVPDYSAVLREFGDRAAGGNLEDLQRMLSAQAIVLDGIFTQFALRTAKATNTEVIERLLRLALKAQSQSRTTVESLAVIQQGPAIFARQANVSNGGNQQVNNGVPAAQPSRARTVKAKEAKQTIPKVAP